MNNFKATPKQWEEVGAFVSATRDCILELRARVMALEAQARNYPAIPDSSTPPPVATDEELGKTYRNSVGCNLDRYRAIYNLGVAHGQANHIPDATKMVPPPPPGVLVKRVNLAIDSALYDEADHQWNKARAAIHEVARWLREQGTPASGWAMRLEQEAGR